MGSVRRSRLVVDLITDGGQGTIFRVPNAKLPFANSLVYKEYHPHVARGLDVDALRLMCAHIEQLPQSEALRLLERASWPCALVEDDAGAVLGFLMPAVPDRFYVMMTKAQGLSRTLGEFQHLLNDPAYVARRGIDLQETHKYQLLEEVRASLAQFHAQHLAVGDLSPKNLLFSLTPPVRVFFVDCDAMRLGARSVATQTETPGWQVRDRFPGEMLATPQSDLYKFGLLALRLLVGDQSARDPNLLPSTVPDDIRKLVKRSVSNPAPTRPAPDDWTGPLRKAVKAASRKPPVKPSRGGSGGTRPPTSPPPKKPPGTAPQQPSRHRSPLTWPARTRTWTAAQVARLPSWLTRCLAGALTYAACALAADTTTTLVVLDHSTRDIPWSELSTFVAQVTSPWSWLFVAVGVLVVVAGNVRPSLTLLGTIAAGLLPLPDLMHDTAKLRWPDHDLDALATPYLRLLGRAAGPNIANVGGALGYPLALFAAVLACGLLRPPPKSKRQRPRFAGTATTAALALAGVFTLIANVPGAPEPTNSGAAGINPASAPHFRFYADAGRVNGGLIATSPEGNHLIVARPMPGSTHGTVTVFSLPGVAREPSVASVATPTSVAYSGDGSELYLLDARHRRLTSVNTVTASITTRDTRPYSSIATGPGNTVYAVAEENGGSGIYRVGPTSGTLVKRLTLPFTRIAVSQSDHRAFVWSTQHSRDVVPIPLAAGPPGRAFHFPQPVSTFVVADFGSMLYAAAAQQVYRVSIATRRTLSHTTIANGPPGTVVRLSASPERKWVWAETHNGTIAQVGPTTTARVEFRLNRAVYGLTSPGTGNDLYLLFDDGIGHHHFAKAG